MRVLIINGLCCFILFFIAPNNCSYAELAPRHLSSANAVTNENEKLAPTTLTTTPISELIGSLQQQDKPNIDLQALSHLPLLTSLYEDQHYQYFWQNKLYANQVIQLLSQANLDGLTPQDYHLNALNILYAEQALNGWPSPSKAAQFDVLLSDAVLKFTRHLRNGKLNPSEFEPSWHYDPVVVEFDVNSTDFLSQVQQQTIADYFAAQRPKYRLYDKLKNALATYQKIADDHSFSVIDINVRSIKPQMSNTALPMIKARLKQLGYTLPDTFIQTSVTDTTKTHFYPLELAEVVKLFQQNHDLEPDGIIGPATLAALNISYQKRADKIKINLERARWLANDLSQEFIIVNIAGFELFFYKNNELTWQTKVVVGKPVQATPVFKSQLQYLEFNPTWTVPRSIVKEMWPRIQTDPDYLSSQHFTVVQDNGNPAYLREDDWVNFTPRNFPFHLVQQPWENNALGQVKFIFPNRHSIFLHDTPQKSLFNSAQRTFSHGCIRVENPMELARQLLNDELNWSSQDITKIVESEKRTRVNIQRPIDVFLMYWTVSIRNNNVIFHQDPYQRDTALMQQLLPISNKNEAKTNKN